MNDARDPKSLQEALLQYDNLINKPMLKSLTNWYVCPASPLTLPIYLVKITHWPSSTTYHQFEFILNALSSIDQIIGCLLHQSHNHLSLYIGIKGRTPYGLEVLKEGLSATFPTIVYEVIPNGYDYLKHLFCKHPYPHLSLTTTIPNTSSSTPLLKSFTNLMQPSSNYMALFLANPVDDETLNLYWKELSELYATISTYKATNINTSHSLAHNGSTTVNNSETITNGDSHTHTQGTSATYNHSNYTNITTSSSFPIHNAQSLNLSYLTNSASGQSHGNTDSCAQGNTSSQANMHSTSTLRAENKTCNEGMSYSCDSKYIQNVLATLSDQLTRIENLSRIPRFFYSAYFLSPTAATSIRAAYSFMGLATLPAPYLGPSTVSLWNTHHASYKHLLENLSRFDTPIFNCKHSYILPSALIESPELLNSLYLPTP